MTQNKTDRSAYLTEFNVNLSQNVDSFDFPIKNKPSLHLAVGDAHGNWFKLIHNAFAAGTVTSSLPDFFPKLRAIYDALNQSPLTVDQFMDYLKLLKTCTVKRGFKDIFIGDTRCARGQNDLLTLAWFALLDEQNSLFRIIFSNHDYDGLRPLANFSEDLKNMSDYEKLFNLSRANMEQFLEANQGNIELMNLYHHYEEVYKKHLVLIDYTVTEEKVAMLYTHAGCGMESIEALAKKYDVTYEESKIEDLLHTVDQINMKFNQHLSNDFNWQLMYENDPDQPRLSDPLFNVIATRQLRPDFRDQPKNGSYRVEHIHGHNGQIPYLKPIPTYFASIPLSQVLPPRIEHAIRSQNALFVVMDSEKESSDFYVIGINKQEEIAVVDFLSTIELPESQQPLQARLRDLQEESKKQLITLGASLKTMARADKVLSFDLSTVIKTIPFMKEYLALIGISRYTKPASLISLDGDLGKIHSLTDRGVRIDWFEKTYTMKLLASVPHPHYHPEAISEPNKNIKRASSPNVFFQADGENLDPNSPERKKKIKPPRLNR